MNLFTKYFSVLCLAALGLLAACEKQEYQSVEALDNQNIEAYIQANNLTVEPLGNTGMYYQVLQEGTGAELQYTSKYPIVYTVKSLDGTYAVTDTFASTNRYMDYLAYFLGESTQGSSYANIPSYQSLFEKDEGLKYAIRTVLQKANGQIRVIVPSRLLSYGRNGNSDLGIPSNASMDYVIRVLDSASLPGYEDENIRKRMEALKLNLADYEKTESGIYYHISEPGDGDTITVDSTLTIAYAGSLLNGSSFDQSDSATFVLSNLIPSWKEILPKLHKGGSVRFFTPSSQAYGASGGSSIPPFSPLDFEITVRKEED